MILDDIGYVQQSCDEIEVLFTFLAERAQERPHHQQPRLRRLDPIFKGPMTTAAAIDRLIHHADILEMTGPQQAGFCLMAGCYVNCSRPCSSGE